MRPPICAVCGKDFRNSISEGGNVHFKLKESEKEFNKKFDEEGYEGHRAGLDWFCEDHIQIAKKTQSSYPF